MTSTTKSPFVAEGDSETVSEPFTVFTKTSEASSVLSVVFLGRAGSCQTSIRTCFASQQLVSEKLTVALFADALVTFQSVEQGCRP